MNTSKLTAWGTAHKKQLLVGGAGIAVAGGLYAAKKKPEGDTEPVAATTDGTGAPMPNYAGGGFDSSSTDVYNALQPQIEATQTMLQKLMEMLNPVVVPPATPQKTNPNGGINPKYWPKKVPTTPPRKTPAPSPRKPVKKVYVVRKGDTLAKIAARLGIKGGWNALYAANKTVIGRNANLIRPGQRLVY